MTFNDDSNLSGKGVRRSGGGGGGRRGAVIGGGSGLVVVAVVIISLVSGVDLTGLLGGGTGSAPTDKGTNLTQCRTGADANRSIDCRVQGARDSLADYWTGEAATLGVSGYHNPEVQLFTGSVGTGCGDATSAVGPFYCPPDQTIYLDTGFYDDLKTQFGATGGPLAQLYVVAHEWGHHIQNLEGTFEKIDQSATGATSDSVRLELQADCYAGSWVAAASSTTDAQGNTLLEPITDAQLKDALNAASVIGDDRIQQQSGGSVNPETWTHGSSAERQRWFARGYNDGPKKCDTFSAATL
ncbi:MAG: putative neutral zinc metallopeptidase [Glaciihabitans sp.]|jgi:predicted metalloprotease|nr:putative neutral zinc metallopeptidase [Glaciihabitans sp.]